MTVSPSFASIRGPICQLGEVRVKGPQAYLETCHSRLASPSDIHQELHISPTIPQAGLAGLPPVTELVRQLCQYNVAGSLPENEGVFSLDLLVNRASAQ